MLTEKHRNEWVQGSGVSVEITELNVESLADETEIRQRLNKDVKRWIKKSLIGPGWWVGDNQAGQYKPDSPRTTGRTDKHGNPKFAKYLSPDAGKDEVFAAHPLLLRIPNDSTYWERVKSDISIPIWELEGAKKAGALLTRGRAAISLPGVTNGQKLGRLHPTMIEFAQAGRTIILAYDADWATNANVQNALKTKIALYRSYGCQVMIATWDTGKGIDDAIVAGVSLEEIEANLVTGQEWINALQKEDTEKALSVLEEMGLDPADEVTNITFEQHVCRRLFQNESDPWIVIHNSFYRYSGKGYWQRQDDEKVLKAIALYSTRAYKTKLVENKHLTVTYPFAKASQADSAFKFSRSILSLTQSDLPKNDHLICFKNGTVSTKTGKLEPHNPKHYLLFCVESDYVPNTECPSVFSEFVSNSYGEALLPLIRACTSMLLDPSCFYGKFIHLMGPSGSGKGTLLSVWQEMFSLDHQRSSDTLSDISNADLRHQHLSGSRLFVLPDVGGYLTSGLKALYSLVDNEPLSGRPLFSPNGYQKQWNTRLVLASVEHLRMENAGDGWTRRAICIPTQARQGPVDITLKSRLAEAKGEIISWALAMPRKDRDACLLYANDMFPQIKRTSIDSAKAGDPVRQFLDKCCRPSADGGTWQGHSLYAAYVAFSRAHGYQGQLNEGNFISHLKNIIPFHYVKRTTKWNAEAKKRESVGAYWRELEFVEGAFDGLLEGSETVSCKPSRCEEGGLEEFIHYADPNYSEEEEQLEIDPIQTEPLTDGAYITLSESGEIIVSPAMPETYRSMIPALLHKVGMRRERIAALTIEDFEALRTGTYELQPGDTEDAENEVA